MGASASPEPCVIGIDVGGTKSLGVVLDQAGEVVVQEKWPTREGAAAVTEMLADLCRELTERAGPGRRVRGLGVGIAGLVDSMGRLRRAPNLTDADEFAIRDLLEPLVGLPVLVDNDANCAARAELHVGVAVGVRHAVLITLGTGIGGALVVDGRVVRGAAGMAGEPGHMLVDPAGPKCVCGLSGCWERYASGAGLAYLGRQAAGRGDLDGVLATVSGDADRIRGEHVTRAARLGRRPGRGRARHLRLVGVGRHGQLCRHERPRDDRGGGRSGTRLGPVRAPWSAPISTLSWWRPSTGPASRSNRRRRGRRPGPWGPPSWPPRRPGLR